MGIDALYGAVVSVAFSAPSSQNSTFATAALSAAAALALSVLPTFTEPGETETLGFVTSTQVSDTERSALSVTLHVEPLHEPAQVAAKPVGPPDAVSVYVAHI